MTVTSGKKGLDAHDSQGVSDNAAYLSSQGYDFAAQYLGDGNSTVTAQGEDQGTAVTSDQILADEHGGLNIVSIFENYGMSDALGPYSWVSYLSFNQGVTDAENAYAAAQNLGQPLNSAIYFAMDFDPGFNSATAPAGYTEISGLNEVINYFEGVDSVFNTVHPDTYQVGVYGAVDTLLAVLGQVPGTTDTTTPLAQYTWRTVSTGWAGNFSTDSAGGMATEDNTGKAWTMIQSDENTTVTNPDPPVPADPSVEIDDDNTSIASFGQWDNIACFLEGTRIATPEREIPVEQLRVGDMVRAKFAGMTPVKWVGQRSIDCRRHPRPENVWPVHVRPGAFGDGKPARDLWLSPDHAAFVDNVLIPIRQLINGTTIAREPRDQVTYFHVELAEHDVLAAEGLPVESYLDTGNRAMFANAGMAMMLHPDFATVNAGLKCWECDACAPLVLCAAEVKPVWARLAARADALGYVAAERYLTTVAELRLGVGEHVLEPLSSKGDWHVFVLPPGTKLVRLISRSGAPSDIRPWLEDHRRLGMHVRRIRLRRDTELTEIPVDHPSLRNGWWAIEGVGTELRRWTDGDAELQLPSGNDARRPVILEIAASGLYAYALRSEQSTEHGLLMSA